MKIPGPLASQKIAPPLVSSALRLCAGGWFAAGGYLLHDPGSAREVTFGVPQLSQLSDVEAKLVDLGSSFVGSCGYIPCEIIALSLLSMNASSLGGERNVQRLLTGLWLLNSSSLVLLAAANATSDGAEIPLTSNLCLTSLLLATLGAVSFRINSTKDGVSALPAKALEDFNEVTDVAKIVTSSSSSLSKFYRVAILITLVVGSAFAFSPVSPLAYSDQSEAVIELMLRSIFGLASIFLVAPIEVCLLEASEMGTVSLGGIRTLNCVVGVSIFFLDLLTATSQQSITQELASTAIETSRAVESLVDNEFRNKINSIAAISVSIPIVAVYLVQALNDESKPDESV